MNVLEYKEGRNGHIHEEEDDHVVAVPIYNHNDEVDDQKRFLLNHKIEVLKSLSIN